MKKQKLMTSCKNCESYSGYRAEAHGRRTDIKTARVMLSQAGIQTYHDGMCAMRGDSAPTGGAQFDLGGHRFCRQFSPVQSIT